ncbi:hypothetical protein VNI00_007041 [Paramarasmius palmivorus]|uniref:Uncharacterized protein n=1 Tax=Paramarasmius palmivorus TaxID=297713 RepID=A0AAW0D6J5_9AGAR
MSSNSQLNDTSNDRLSQLHDSRYDELLHVAHEDITITKDLGSVIWNWNLDSENYGYHQTETSIHTLEIRNLNQRFTGVQYKGTDAQRSWEKDLKHITDHDKLRAGSFELYGINQSGTLMIIFHREMIPLNHFYSASLPMNVYISYLTVKEKCNQTQLWLDVTKGIFCAGPHGPSTSIQEVAIDKTIIPQLPSTQEMLEDSACIKFFTQFRSESSSAILDANILDCARRYPSAKPTHPDLLYPKILEGYECDDPQHASRYERDPLFKRCEMCRVPRDVVAGTRLGLQFDTVYSPSLGSVARWPSKEAERLWKWDAQIGLTDETILGNGLTRFKLSLHVSMGLQVWLQANYGLQTLLRTWLSQSHRVFGSLKTEPNFESFFVTRAPVVELKFIPKNSLDDVLKWLRSSASGHQESASSVDKNAPPIYLFLRAPPMSIPEFMSWKDGHSHSHFWSLDENGQTEMSEEESKRWKVPTLHRNGYYARCEVETCQQSTYASLYDWQVARGFDPTTAAFARQCGYPELDIITE